MALDAHVEEIHRREKVVRIFPHQQSARRLVGALCAEQYEEWSSTSTW